MSEHLEELSSEVSSLLKSERARPETVTSEMQARVMDRLKTSIALGGAGILVAAQEAALSAHTTQAAATVVEVGSGAASTAATSTAATSTAATSTAMFASKHILIAATSFALGGVSVGLFSQLLAPQILAPQATKPEAPTTVVVQPSQSAPVAPIEPPTSPTQDTPSQPAEQALAPIARPETAATARRNPRENEERSGDGTGDQRDADLARERSLLERARTSLSRGDADAALLALVEHSSAFPSGRLSEEREALAVQALMRLNRMDEARTRATRFRARYPNSVLMPLVSRALEQPQP